MSKNVRIDFVSDVVCPWCAVGLASLQQALAKVGDEVRAELHFQPFELNPDLPREGETIAEHLGRKYGMTPEQLKQNGAALVQRAAAVGFGIDLDKRDHIWNTFDAHRLLHWAGTLGEAQQAALKLALLRAYHTEGRNVSDRDVLAQIVGEAGLDATAAAEVLASGRYTDEVRADERYFLERGIHSVPAIILDQQYLISGGQPPEVFENALRQLAAQK